MNKNQKLFIEYVVTNLLMLNEAYGKADLERLTKKFKDQAEAFSIKGKGGNNLTEDEIKAIINGFDYLRRTHQNSIPTDKRDIDKWNLKDLIKFVVDKVDIEPEDKDKEEEVDQTPDVVYDDNNYVMWNGSKEGNCITYGAGERWCITKGSFSSYRYSSDRGYPTFYLVKNKNLPQDNKLSFVAIQIRNKPENERYVYTNRKNSPYESRPMSWEELNNEIPWLRNIPNVKDLIKYIGIGKEEEKQRAWGNYNGLSEEEFDALSFSNKTAYLSRRKASTFILEDIRHRDFLKNYLENYPRLQEWIASFPFEFGFSYIINDFDVFTPQQQQSIAIKVNNIDHGGNDITINNLNNYSYKNIIKLVELNPKAFSNSNTYLVKTSGGSYLTYMQYDNNDVDFKYYSPNGRWVSLKLNAASEDLFFNHPAIIQLPFKLIIKILRENNLSPKKVRSLLYKIEKKEDGFDKGGFEVQMIGDKKILFDVNNIIPIAYDITGGNVTKININAPENADIKEEFKNLMSKDADFKVKIGVNLVKNPNSIGSFTQEEINNIFEDAPTDIWERITAETGDADSRTFYFLDITPNTVVVYRNDGRYITPNSGYFSTLGTDDADDFIRAINKANYKYNDEGIEYFLRSTNSYNIHSITPNLPVSEENTYRYINLNGSIYRYQPANLADSNKWSRSRNDWVRGVVRPQDIGQQAVAGGGRGRPAGAANGAAAPAAAAPAAGGGNIYLVDAFTDAGLETGYASLPISSRRRLQSALASNVQMGGDRGTTARQNQLGQTGRISSVLSIETGGHQPSKVYFITMANGSVIASINIQPGNLNYIVTSTANYLIDSPRQLLQALQQRNLAEGMKSYIVKNYLTLNPHQIDEVKTMLRAYISNKKK